MVSTINTLNLEEKYNRVRRNFCFYLDIQDHGLARSLSRRLQDMGLQQEVFLTSRVTHVVREAPCSARGDMLRRARANQHTHLVQLTVQKAISLLDKLYDTFFTAPRKALVKPTNKHFIKIEFLDKLWRPVFKEFDEWPALSLEPDPPKDKRDKKDNATPVNPTNDINQNHQTADQKMTRKSRPRIKEKEEKEPKGGYCEMCNADYVDAALHRRSPHHLAFVRDNTNFLSLDSLIGSGADVTTFLDKATPINGERRSLRKMCNGEVEQPKSKRSKRSQSPDSTVNGNTSPKRNGVLEDEKKHNTRCSKQKEVEDRKYYKVVGVSTKLRSSGGFVTKPKSPPAVNGAKPLVVKFRKVRKSELSVLSDEAEQFMFPKRASSTSSTSSDEDEKEETLSPRKKTPQPPPPPLSTERRRLARPLALKEESSEEDIWPEDNRRRKRRAPPVKRGRRVPLKPPAHEPTPEKPPPPAPVEPDLETPQQEVEICPLREEPVEKCMKWEDGKLKYTPAVEQLEFAFESVPQSEPWYETFKRQDQDKVLTKNVPQYFTLYSKSPKLPYEIGQLPPLKPNCCPLSDLVKREDKPGPSRSYGTRGMKKQRTRKRTAALIALEGHPRKSPREHASTLAILGSAGLLHRRKHVDDAKSTASEDTISDTISNIKVEPVVSEMQEASERLKQFLSEVFDDAAEFEVSEEAMEGEPAVVTSTTAPDVSSLVSECDGCDIIRGQIEEQTAERSRPRRGKVKKKNRTGWPSKKKVKKSSRTSSLESDRKASSLDRSSAESPDNEDTTQNTISEEDTEHSEMENTVTEAEDSQDKTLEAPSEDKTLEASSEDQALETSSEDKTVEAPSDDKTVEAPSEVESEEEVKRPMKVDSEGEVKPVKKRSPRSKQPSRSSGSSDEREERTRKKRALAGLLLQPVVRVARVDPSAARTLRSNARPRNARRR